MAALVAQRCRAADLPCQLGTSHPGAQASRSRIRRAAQLHPSAIQVILPDWLPLSWPEVLGAGVGFEQAADGVPLVPNNPPHTKTRLTPEQLGELGRRFSGLIGVKVAGGDAEWCRRARAAVGNLSLFVAGHTLAAGLANGAYSNIACLSPAGAVRWNASMMSDPSAALASRAGSRPSWTLTCCRGNVADSALPRSIRHSHAPAGGHPISTRVGWPYASVSENAADRLGAVAREELPELFDGATC